MIRRLALFLAIPTLATVLSGCAAVSTATKKPTDEVLDRVTVMATTPCGRGVRGIGMARIAQERFGEAADTSAAIADSLNTAHLADNDTLVQSLRLALAADLGRLYIPAADRERMGWDGMSATQKLSTVIRYAVRYGEAIAPLQVDVAAADAACGVN